MKLFGPRVIQLAALGLRPSKIKTCRLKEEASLQILMLKVFCSGNVRTLWVWPIVTTPGGTHQNSPSSSTVIPIFSLSLLLTFCHSSELWEEYRVITARTRDTQEFKRLSGLGKISQGHKACIKLQPCNQSSCCAG